MPLITDQIDLCNRATAISDAAAGLAVLMLGKSQSSAFLLGHVAALMRMTIELGDRLEVMARQETGAEFPWRPEL